ncbi:MAG: hypothetical protein IPM39_19370 [Chloroflexi bacterium]|nr:hypothetical protein [Chloroflexota bacterium]
MQTAYTVVSEKPVEVWIPGKLLEDRLDAEFYQPVYLRTVEALKSAGFPLRPLQKLSSYKSRVYWGIKGLDEPISSTHIPYIRPNEATDDGWIEYDDLTTIERHWANDMPGALVQPGDLLVEVKGNARKVHVVREDVPSLTFVSGSMYRFVPKNDVDVHYLWAYLTSQTCQTLKERLMSNSIIKWINPDDICQMSVLVPPRPLQTYIGAKVRLAEQCRRNGRELDQETEGFFDRILKRLSPTSNSVQTNAIEPSEIVTERLDAKFYQSIYIDIERYIVTHPEGYKTIGELVSSISNGVEYRDFVADGIPYLTVGNIRDGRLDLENAPKIPNDPSIPERGKIKANDILIVRTGSIGQSAFVRIDDSEAIISSHFIRLRLKQPQQAPWIVFFLNSWAGKLLQERITYGAVQPQIGQELLMGLPIPNIGADNSKYISAIVQKQYMLFDKATKLTKAAKADVEALIEGRLDVAGIMDGRLQPPTWPSIQQELSLTKSVSEPV